MAVVDVVSLYTNIPHDEGLGALRHFLNQRPGPALPSTEFLVGLAERVLTMNAFRYGEQHYLQVRGTAMGTRMAPSYANLFMGHLEQEFLGCQSLRPLLWVRFIDDIFLLWHHGEQLLRVFLDRLGGHGSVRFTHQISADSITFLDVDVALEGGQFRTRVHIKPTNPQQYLSYTSCHPPHTKRSIPRSLSVRGNRISGDRVDRASFNDGLHQRLLERGYPSSVLRQRIVPAHVDHHPPTQQRNPDRIFLTTLFFPGVHRIHKMMKDLHPMLLNNSQTREIFSTLPGISYRRPNNIGNILSRRDGRVTTGDAARQPGGCGLHPCGRRRCLSCGLVLEDETFCSPNNPNMYPVAGLADCTSTNCVYELLCQYCEGFYVGKATTPLNLRINNHRASVRPDSDQPAGRHAFDEHRTSFNDCYRLKILKRLPPSAPGPKVEESEDAHIWVLGALHPPGLNSYT